MNESELPVPPVPAEVDLRDFAFMPLDVQRLRDSEIAAVESAEAFRGAVLAWAASWHQVPAASLPDDDASLARLLGYGRAGLALWKKARTAGALRGFTKCSDGRLYHAIVAEKAMDAWRRKVAARERSKAGNAARWGATKQSSAVGPRAIPQGSFTESRSDPDAIAEASNGDSRKDRKGQGQREGERKSTYSRPASPNASAPEALPKRTSAKRQPASWKSDPGFVSFWQEYPRRIDAPRAFVAWTKAIKGGATPGDILAGLARHPFSDDPQFIPHPTTWLNGARWEFQPTSPSPLPALRPLRTANGVVLTDEQLFQVAT